MKRNFLSLTWLARLDHLLRGLLVFLFAGIILTSSMANIQTDAIDYYAIVQRLVGDTEPIVPQLSFVEQRSPGFPLLSLPAYYVLKGMTFWITPETVHIEPANRPPRDAGGPSEQMLLPPQPLLFRDIFFKNYSLSPAGAEFKWNIIAAMLLTGYGFFFAGLFASGKALALVYPRLAGVSLPALIALTSMVLLHNLVNTPAYATLTIFGVSGLFTWFWVRGWQSGSAWAQWAAGLFAGLMVLTRLETVLIVVVLAGALALGRQFRYLGQLALGGLLPLALLLLYNATQFGNPLHAGILKGDMNILTVNLSYVLAALVRPQSGILFWSALTALGLVGLFVSQSPALRPLGWAALALIVLVALRVPAMYACVGQGERVIGGIPIACPENSAAMLNLIRFDANRYVIPLLPFAALGLRGLLGRLGRRLRP